MILALVGPTGVGKTALSIALAKHYEAVIINFDSMQVYEQLDIGTAKVTAKEMEGVPHYLLSFVPLTKTYTVYDYQKEARELLDRFLSQGRNVIFVGGTGLYLKAVFYDYQFEKEKTVFDFSDLSNEELLEQIKKEGVSDPPHVNNRRRLERLYSKIKNKESLEKKGDQLLYPVTFVGLEAPREILYERINQRVDEMFQDGLLEEVEKVKDYFPVSKALQTGIGYKEFLPYFQGECTLDEVKEEIKKNSRHYAKRQFTFFRNQFPVMWFETNYESFDQTIHEVLVAIEKGTS